MRRFTNGVTKIFNLDSGFSSSFADTAGSARRLGYSMLMYNGDIFVFNNVDGYKDEDHKSWSITGLRVEDFTF